MSPFPFTDDEWGSLEELALSFLNASFAEDLVLKESLRLDIIDLLENYLKKHGDHPVLLETIADYLEDSQERFKYYRNAIKIAELNSLPTLSIRMAFAGALLGDSQLKAALEMLRSCGTELSDADEKDRVDWCSELAITANFTEDNTESIALHQEAITIATEFGLPSITIRLGLADRLLGINDTQAVKELRACEHELPLADENDQTRWKKLMAEALSENGNAPRSTEGT